jgi:transketolase C-terminal domain/subunit
MVIIIAHNLNSTKENFMVLGVIVAVMMGFTAGVAVETNEPAVDKFGQKYFSADSQKEAQANPSPKKH